jgi:copper chaperone CopZ
MKTVNIILTMVLSLAMLSGIHAQNKNNEAEVTFNVSMDCDHCKKKIMNSIPHEKGVTDMKVDLVKKEVWIKFDSKKTDKAKLQKAVEKLGYTVTEVVSVEKKQQDVAADCKAEHEGCQKKCGGHK